MKETVTIRRDVFLNMRIALAVAHAVLEKNRFTGTDQNPEGVRDLVGSATYEADRIQID